MTSKHCYHCGLPNPRKPLTLEIEGKTEEFCCTGCKSAAETIIASGLGEYYRFHQPDQQPVDVELSDKQLQTLLIYDRDDVQAEFVSSNGSTHSAILIIEGISCSACTWLIEKRLMQLEGVTQALVNAGTHRLSIEWDGSKTNLSDIFKALYLIGYRASPFLPDQEEQVRLRTQRHFILRLGVAGIGMMQAMMNAVALYSGDINHTHEIWLWWTSLFLTLPVILISAWPFFTAAYHSIRGHQLSMDVSVSIAILSAFFASVLATFTGKGEVFYESVNMFTFFLVLSRFLEFRARTMAGTQGNAITGSLPQTCTRIVNGASQEISVRDLDKGETIQLLPGETCPVDGILTLGESKFDESSITGEFKGAIKSLGDPVYAGTINRDRAVNITVSEMGHANSFNLLQNLVERASSEKPRIAELADRGSKQFIWTTLIISLVIGLTWLAVDPSRAFWIVISVLVVTCPCALSLATPTALAQATAKLKRDGFVITRGYVLEKLSELEELAFDKTGTLTEGRFLIRDVIVSPQYSYTIPQVIDICSQLESHSEHAIATAFKTHGNTIDTNVDIDDRKSHPGLGVMGQSKLGYWKLGSSTFTLKNATNLNTDEDTYLYLTLNDNLVASITLSDRLRSTSEIVLANLKKLGINTHVLTGDSNPHMRTELQSAGVTGEINIGMQAEEKLNWVNKRTNRNIAVVGDGINDAPVLAGAPLSIAMLNATDLTKTQADVLLLNNNLNTIAQAIIVAKKTKKIIRQNLIWALIYNAVALPIASLGWVAPWQAAIGMSFSSLLVVGNALRLRR